MGSTDVFRLDDAPAAARGWVGAASRVPTKRQQRGKMMSATTSSWPQGLSPPCHQAQCPSLDAVLLHRTSHQYLHRAGVAMPIGIPCSVSTDPSECSGRILHTSTLSALLSSMGWWRALVSCQLCWHLCPDADTLNSVPITFHSIAQWARVRVTQFNGFLPLPHQPHQKLRTSETLVPSPAIANPMQSQPVGWRPPIFVL